MANLREAWFREIGACHARGKTPPACAARRSGMGSSPGRHAGPDWQTLTSAGRQSRHSQIDRCRGIRKRSWATRSAWPGQCMAAGVGHGPMHFEPIHVACVGCVLGAPGRSANALSCPAAGTRVQAATRPPLHTVTSSELGFNRSSVTAGRRLLAHDTVDAQPAGLSQCRRWLACPGPLHNE